MPGARATSLANSSRQRRRSSPPHSAQPPRSLRNGETIEPLGVTNVPPFPVSVLPEVLADFVAAEAEATQTPADLAAMLCLAVCAAAVAKKVEVQVRDQWLEPVNLFTVTVLEPGNRKSAVFSHTTAPLREFEAQLIEQERPEIARQLARRRQRERQMRVARREGGQEGRRRGGPGGRRDRRRIGQHAGTGAAPADR